MRKFVYNKYAPKYYKIGIPSYFITFKYNVYYLMNYNKSRQRHREFLKNVKKIIHRINIIKFNYIEFCNSVLYTNK